LFSALTPPFWEDVPVSLDVRLATTPGRAGAIALPVRPADDDDDGVALRVPASVEAPEPDLIDAFLADAEHTGAAGTTASLPRPGARPHRVLLVGTGTGDEKSWRSAGAAIARAAARETSVTVGVPDDLEPDALRALAEGLLLGSYRWRLVPAPDSKAPRLRRVTIVAADTDAYAEALAAAKVTAEMTCWARDLTNTPSAEKTPDWFARQVQKAAGRRTGLTVTVRDPDDLRREGFGGILAVGGGSSRGPRLVELRWRPRGATRHVVLVGKGITFDTGGIDLKPRENMLLMRKDMGGAAAVVGATLAAAALRLPVKVTCLAPLAENMVSGTAYRPGDVVRHYGGLTSEIHNTDAEGRVVVADALAYADRRLKPDLLVDLCTLTGAQHVALGKRTAALYTDNDDLATDLLAAADRAGEKAWRLPLANDYTELLASDIADFNQAPGPGNAGSIVAALSLREFTGDTADRWAHLDMSSPSWIDSTDAELVNGATGWGVRTLLRWLEIL